MKKHSLIRTGLKITGLLLTVLTFMIIYLPILIILVMSINDSTRGFGWEGFTLKWYMALIVPSAYPEMTALPNLIAAIIDTLSVAVLSTIIATILGTLFAIGINAMNKKRRVRMVVMNNIPIVNPDIVTGISLLIIFSLLSFSLSFYTVLIAHIFFSIPYVVLSVLPKLKKLDPNMYEAGLDLGCSRASGIWKVIIPNISTGILAGALLAFTMSIDDFVITYFTSGDEYLNVSTWLYTVLKHPRHFTPAVYAYNVIIFVITIIIIIFINNVRERKEKITHEKTI
ncbi:MAG: ABC transporter permease subunit [Candidatus Izemoplasmatales bacterium]|jgi:spermidine/putrescine transport system permease protein|nr:ABC transporter permease subunit [Candidatus Izemoplasmatales bacterium]MDD3864764.1 ABC transporter permease subunit [Candidatus Izemoplasmatales bacterium]